MHALDLTGLSIEDAMEVAARDLDATVAAGLDHLDHCEQRLLDLGADAEEFAIKFQRERAELVAWRDKSLAELREWLERDGAMLN